MKERIGDHEVIFKQRISLKDGHRLPKLLQKLGEDDLQDGVPVLQAIIESWTFPGDPTDAAAYDDLDLVAEFVPLLQAAGEYLQVVFAPLANKKSRQTGLSGAGVPGAAE